MRIKIPERLQEQSRQRLLSAEELRKKLANSKRRVPNANRLEKSNYKVSTEKIILKGFKDKARGSASHS